MSSKLFDDKPLQFSNAQDLFRQNENQDELFKKINSIIVPGGAQLNINQDFLKDWINYTLNLQNEIQEKTDKLYKYLMKCNQYIVQEIKASIKTKKQLEGECELQKPSTKTFCSILKYIQNLKVEIDDKFKNKKQLHSYNIIAAQLETEKFLESTKQVLQSLEQYSNYIKKLDITTSSGFFHSDSDFDFQKKDEQIQQRQITKDKTDILLSEIQSIESIDTDEQQ